MWIWKMESVQVRTFNPRTVSASLKLVGWNGVCSEDAQIKVNADLRHE